MALTMRVAVAVMGLARPAARSRIGFAFTLEQSRL